MKMLKKLFINNSGSMILRLTVALSIVVMFISVGFASLTSTLSINGSARFEPVGMIRVMSIVQNSLTDVTEIESSYTQDTIHVQMDFDETTGVAIYDVNITNLGQTDKVLSQVVDQLFSNNDIEYEMTGLAIDDVIEAGDSVNFQITFKYKNGVSNPDPRLNANIQFVFDDYVPPSTFQLVFSQEGACTFNGSSATITGTECADYAGQYYIDTGVKLYDTDNWQKDYEIGFTIESYVPSQQVKQAVFVNAKYEKDSLKWPGLVFRRKDATAFFELTESINNGTKASEEISTYTLPLEVTILRISGVVYYSLNGGPLITLQDMSNFNQQFDVTTTFGASKQENGTPFRHVIATMSNMYIKLGTYQPESYTVTFNPNGGNVTEQTRDVARFSTVGPLPTPTNTANQFFAGWYTDNTYQTKVDEHTIIKGDTEFVAKWTSRIVEVNGTPYGSVNAALLDIDTTPTTITAYDDLNERVVLPSDKTIILDLNGHTMTNPENEAVITNSGNLTLKNGTMRNEVTFAVIDNNSTGTLVLEDMTLINTSTKQGVYNNGGTLTIKGDSYLETSTVSARATVHNLNNGTVHILSGTIIAQNQPAINNVSGTLIIGTEGGGVDTTNPMIQGKTVGVTSSVNYSFYDGIIKGRNNAVNDDTKITQYEQGYQKTTGTDGNYHTLYLQQ